MNVSSAPGRLTTYATLAEKLQNVFCLYLNSPFKVRLSSRCDSYLLQRYEGRNQSNFKTKVEAHKFSQAFVIPQQVERFS